MYQQLSVGDHTVQVKTKEDAIIGHYARLDVVKPSAQMRHEARG